jgi:hypothetical protein
VLLIDLLLVELRYSLMTKDVKIIDELRYNLMAFNEMIRFGRRLANPMRDSPGEPSVVG